MLRFDRITFDPHVMGGRACLRGMRVMVSWTPLAITPARVLLPPLYSIHSRLAPTVECY